MKVGDEVFVFDHNRRVYAKRPSGEFGGGPIYREHFVKKTIIGETSRSWLLQHWPKKIPKSTLAGVYTAEQVEDECWIDEHRCKIVRALERTRDAKILRQVAELIDYKVQP